MFFYHFLQLCPRGHISKMLAVTVIKTRLLSAFGIFKSISCLIRMRLRKIFFSKHVLLSFSSTLSPRSYLEMLAVTVIKNTVRLWNFQIQPYSNAFEKNFFSKHVLLSFSSTLSPRSYLEMLAVTVIKNTVKAPLEFSNPFPALFECV